MFTFNSKHIWCIVALAACLSVQAFAQTDFYTVTGYDSPKLKKTKIVQSQLPAPLPPAGRVADNSEDGAIAPNKDEAVLVVNNDSIDKYSISGLRTGRVKVKNDDDTLHPFGMIGTPAVIERKYIIVPEVQHQVITKVAVSTGKIAAETKVPGLKDIAIGPKGSIYAAVSGASAAVIVFNPDLTHSDVAIKYGENGLSEVDAMSIQDNILYITQAPRANGTAAQQFMYKLPVELNAGFPVFLSSSSASTVQAPAKSNSALAPGVYTYAPGVKGDTVRLALPQNVRSAPPLKGTPTGTGSGGDGAPGGGIHPDANGTTPEPGANAMLLSLLASSALWVRKQHRRNKAA